MTAPPPNFPETVALNSVLLPYRDVIKLSCHIISVEKRDMDDFVTGGPLSNLVEFYHFKQCLKNKE